jgi:hypothetical protein
MKNTSFDIPILFIVFNRLETTKRVFNSIRNIKPRQLFIAADGPRPNKPTDIEKCNSVIEYIANNIDWPCNVNWLKRNENYGCGLAVSSAITWFFDNVEMGIILEDDCLPHQYFFSFCQELLIKYKDNSHITHINGYNCQNGIKRGNYSYYFSKYFHVWGWASWRRAWQNYSYNLKYYDLFLKENVLKRIYNNPYIKEHWLYNFNQIIKKNINTWDYQWVYTNIIMDGIAITPNFNLIENIGMDTESTHNFSGNIHSSSHTKVYIERLDHPYFILIDNNADNYTYKYHVGINFIFKFKYIIKKFLRSFNLWRKI